MLNKMIQKAVRDAVRKELLMTTHEIAAISDHLSRIEESVEKLCGNHAPVAEARRTMKDLGTIARITKSFERIASEHSQMVQRADNCLVDLQRRAVGYRGYEHGRDDVIASLRDKPIPAHISENDMASLASAVTSKVIKVLRARDSPAEGDREVLRRELRRDTYVWNLTKILCQSNTRKPFDYSGYWENEWDPAEIVEKLNEVGTTAMRLRGLGPKRLACIIAAIKKSGFDITNSGLVDFWDALPDSYGCKAMFEAEAA